MNDELCRGLDDFVWSRTYWVVNLNNGETIYQDDERPSVSEHSAWVRLRNYCQATGLYITRMVLQFRSHIEEPLPNDADGYFFCHQALGMVGLTGNWRDQTTETLGFYVIGYVKDGRLYTQQWKVPELQLGIREERPLDLESPCLILRPNATGLPLRPTSSSS